MDKLIAAETVRDKFQRPFIYVLARETLNAIKIAKEIGVYDQLAIVTQNKAEVVMQGYDTMKKTPDLSILGKSIAALWHDDNIAKIITASLIFHPHRESIV